MRWLGRVCTLSASACSLDQRTSFRKPRGCGCNRCNPTDQYPPSSEGPNMASCEPNAENACEMCAREIAGISAPDDNNRPCGKPVKYSHHSHAKITVSLWNARKSRRPDAAFQAFMVRRHREDGFPSRMLNVSQQRPCLMPEPPRGLRHSDVAAQSGFDTARQGFFHHNNQTATVFRRSSHVKSGCRFL